MRWFIVVCYLITLSSWAAESVNQIDAKGNRQGFWTITGNVARDVNYPGNSRVEEGNYEDGRKEGVWKRFWPSGKIRSEIIYQSGHPSGAYTLYYENGKPEETGTWHYGRCIGLFKRFYPNGKIQQILNYNAQGFADGTQQHYHEDGSVAMTCKMIAGKEWDQIIWFEPNGIKHSSIPLSDGINMSTVGPDTHSEKMGLPWSNIYPGDLGTAATPTNHQPNAAQKFERDGYNALYDLTGQLMQAGYFRNGILHNGRWYFYNSDGIMMAIRCYRDGLFIGHYPLPKSHN